MSYRPTRPSTRRAKTHARDGSMGHDMSRLRPYCRDGLAVLFVALNPPIQSHTNGPWFSGKSSRFFHLLHRASEGPI